MEEASIPKARWLTSAAIFHTLGLTLSSTASQGGGGVGGGEASLGKVPLFSLENRCRAFGKRMMSLWPFIDP